jgi:hypothetical protein
MVNSINTVAVATRTRDFLIPTLPLPSSRLTQETIIAGAAFAISSFAAGRTGEKVNPPPGHIGSQLN